MHSDHAAEGLRELPGSAEQMMGADIEKLRRNLANAFSDRAYPGDDRIAETRPWIPEYEGNRVARYFKGKRWEDLSYQKLRAEYPADPTACVHFMLDEGFRYYLPGFLTMALDLKEAGDIADAICGTLTEPPHDAPAEDKARFTSRMSGLSSEEKNAVREVLESLASEYDRAGYPDNPARAALKS
jgi:hypothetical protein